MADERRQQRPSSSAPRGSGSRGAGNRGATAGKSTGKPAGKSGRGAPSGSRGGRSGDRTGRSSDWKRPVEKQVPRTFDQAQYDGPPMPEHITGKELDRSVAAQLKGLPEKLAARVAKHLVGRR